jgi:hypothetical protein
MLSRDNGWEHAVKAMDDTFEATGGLDPASVELQASRLAAGQDPIEYDEPIDLKRIRHRLPPLTHTRRDDPMKTNDGIERLRADARSLFISTATIDDTLSWATPRQIDAIGRMLRCELDNRDTAKRERLLRRARFPVMKTLDGYDYTHVRLPDGYTRDQLTSLEFLDHAQDLVFYGRTGRGKTHLATALGVKAIGQGRAVRFCQNAELVLQLGKAKRAGSLDQILKDPPPPI